MKKVVGLLLIIGTFLSLLPTPTKAVTLADYKRLLKQYQDKYAESQAGINKTEDEIKQTNKEIENIKAEMISMSSEIAILNEDKILYEEEIAAKELETKKLVEYLQLSGGEDVYLEYAFGADNTTDLIYRMAIVEQITNYNEESIKELHNLIKKSEQREKEINKKEKELNAKRAQLESLIVSLGEDKSILTEAGLSASKQIELYKKQVKHYEDLKCKDNDVIGKDCAVEATTGSFKRPLISGWITSDYGMRTLTYNGKTTRSLHKGVDITNTNPYKTKVYASAPGTAYRFKDAAGALCIIIKHYYTPEKKYYSSFYCHMSSYNPKIKDGTKVTTDTWLGYVGNTGISTGPHLHFEINKCAVFDPADKNCGSWNKYVAFAESQYKKGYKGPRTFISFPKAYSKWTAR